MPPHQEAISPQQIEKFQRSGLLMSEFAVEFALTLEQLTVDQKDILFLELSRYLVDEMDRDKQKSDRPV